MATEWTRARHPETGGEAILPVGAMQQYAARGWEPFGEPATDRLHLVRQQDEEAAEAAKAAERRVQHAAEAAAVGTVTDVLEAVGGDPVAAQAALDAETAKPAKDQRKTLVPKLEEITDRPDPATTEGN